MNKVNNYSFRILYCTHLFISKFGFMFLSFTINDFAWAIKHKLFFLSYFINNNLNVRYLCVLNIYNVKMLVKYVLICDILSMIARRFVCLLFFFFVLEKGYFLKKYQQFSINFIFALFCFVLFNFVNCIFSHAFFSFFLFFLQWCNISLVLDSRKGLCVWVFVFG